MMRLKILPRPRVPKRLEIKPRTLNIKSPFKYCLNRVIAIKTIL